MILYSDLIHGIFYPIKLALNGVVFVLMFTAFVLSSGQPLTPSIVFTSIVLVGSLRITITGTMNEALLGLQETKVALSRIQVNVQIICRLFSLYVLYVYTVCCIYDELCM